MKSLIECPNCHKMLTAGATSCPRCGRLMIGPEPADDASVAAADRVDGGVSAIEARLGLDDNCDDVEAIFEELGTVLGESAGGLTKAEKTGILSRIDELERKLGLRAELIGSCISMLGSARCAVDEFAAFRSSEIGDTVYFGTYDLDGLPDGTKKRIEWQVLAKEEDRMLVISRFALDCRPYNTEAGGVTWENCSLRRWLNTDFFDSAFSDDEKGRIETAELPPHENPRYDTDPGNATVDRVFLLSIREMQEHYDSNEERMCVPTEFAKANGAETNNNYRNAAGEKTCWWWLRSPGYDQYNAACVGYSGAISNYGSHVEELKRAVRPAMWISLK